MGRPRGKGKKPIDAANTDEAGSGGEEVAPAYKRREKPQKPLKDGIAEEQETDKIKQDEDDTKTTVSSHEPKNSVENVGKKRRRQPRHGTDTVTENGGPARPNGFRQNRSRRKSTPRRAAEAGVECK